MAATSSSNAAGALQFLSSPSSTALPLSLPSSNSVGALRGNHIVTSQRFVVIIRDVINTFACAFVLCSRTEVLAAHPEAILEATANGAALVLCRTCQGLTLIRSTRSTEPKDAVALRVEEALPRARCGGAARVQDEVCCGKRPSCPLSEDEEWDHKCLPHRFLAPGPKNGQIVIFELGTLIGTLQKLAICGAVWGDPGGARQEAPAQHQVPDTVLGSRAPE